MKRQLHQRPLIGKQSLVIATLVCLAGISCVRVPIHKDKIETRLITATANGQTLLCWDSRTNLLYTVLVADRFDAPQWQPLANFANLRGTGAMMQFHLPEDVNRPRCYKLMALPLSLPTKSR